MRYDVVIIGGGIVGLATALQLLEQKPTIKLCILEKEDGIARHQTGHNSGVIHSGIYYKPGSLKAINCIKGYDMILDFCKKHNIDHDMCGKVIVATSEAELTPLDNIYNRGIENGLQGIKKLNKGELKEIEPHVNGISGLFVPQTGIIDYKQVSAVYAKLIQELGGEILLNHKVSDIQEKDAELNVIANGNNFNTRLVINCAGLYSDKMARKTFPDLDIKIIPFRGEYYMFKDSAKHLVKNLIYPVPNPNFPFLGVHFTRMIGGEIEAGPNAVLAFKREGYNLSDVNLAELFESLAWPGFQKVAMKYWKIGFGEMHRSISKAAFTKALQKLLPEIQADDLTPAHAGVRAQACDRNGNLLDDFSILERDKIINVCNAPSPAATSSLAIGETIAGLALKQLN
ncbi:MAG: L-2-hydroxyglutarate oxidase [Flavobacteriales bacterium]|nr:L-2-hydroxyglutarate oxidase [Flavobacteriales bacterium]